MKLVFHFTILIFFLICQSLFNGFKLHIDETETDTLQNNHNEFKESIIYNDNIHDKINQPDQKKKQKAQTNIYNIELKLEAKFVTLNNFPIRNGEVTMNCDNLQVGPLKPDVYGKLDLVLYHSNNNQEQQIKCEVKLYFGLKFVEIRYPVTFEKKDNYKIQKTFTFTTQDAKNIQTTGCIQDEKLKAISDVDITLYYFSGSIFMDGTIIKTDKKGCFKADDKIGIFNGEYKTQVTIEKEGYKRQQLNLLSDINNLKQSFLAPIILEKSSFASIVIHGQVIDQYGDFLPGADATATCQGKGKGDKPITFKTVKSDVEGKILIQNDKELKIQNQFSCSIIIEKKSEYYNKITKLFQLDFDNSFTIKLGKIELEQQKIQGEIQGYTETTLGGPIADITISVKSSDKHVQIKETKSDKKGKFLIKFQGYKGRDYSIVISATKLHYQQVDQKINLNLKNNYKHTLPKNSLVMKYIPQTIQAQVSGQVIQNNKEVQNIEISASITPSPTNSPQTKIKTDKNGKFQFNFNGYDVINYAVDLSMSDIDYAFKKEEQFHLNSKNKFQENLGKVEVIHPKIDSVIQGQLQDREKNPIQNGNVEIVIKNQKTQKQVEKSTIKSDQNGKFIYKYQIQTGESYKAQIFVKAQFFSQQENIEKDINRQDNYSLNLKEITLDRQQVQAIIQGACINQQTNKPFQQDQGLVYIKSISPKIRQIPQKSKCGAQGKYSLEFMVGDGLDYNIQVQYDDKNQQYVNDVKEVQLAYKNKYTIKNQKFILFPGIIFILEKGTVGNYLSIPIQKANVQLSFDQKQLKNVKGQTDQKGSFQLQEKLIVKSIGQDKVKGEIQISKEHYTTNKFPVTFEQIDQFTYKVKKFKANLLSDFAKATVQGTIIDNLNNPLENALIHVIQINHDLTQTVVANTQKVDKKTGAYSLDASISPDYEYLVKASYQYCEDTFKELDVGDYKGKSSIETQRVDITLPRKQTKLVLKLHVLNSFYEPISKNTLYSVDFDSEAHKNGAKSLQDTEIGTEWFTYYTIMIYQGLEYKATLDLEASGYLYNTQYLNFNLSNNYKIVFKQLILYRQKTPARVSGKVKNMDSQQGIQNVEVKLLFRQGEVSKHEYVQISQKDGSFVFDLQMEENYEYDVVVLARNIKYKDEYQEIKLNKKNNYSNTKIEILMNPQLEKQLGSLSGTLFQFTGLGVANCELDLHFEVQNMNLKTKTDSSGNYKFENINLVKGNIYNPVLTINPQKNSNFKPKQVDLIMGTDGIYDLMHQDFIIEYQQVEYVVKGKVFSSEQNHEPLVNAKVHLLFLNQRNSEDLTEITDVQGNFILKNDLNKGFLYAPRLYVTLNGYTSYLKENLPLQYNSKKNIYELKNDLKIELHRSVGKIQMDLLNFGIPGLLRNDQYVHKLQGYVFSKNSCEYFRKQFIRFARIEMFFYYNNLDDKQLMGYSYTDLNGEFQLDVFKGESNILLSIIIDGYDKKYLFLEGGRTQNLGGIQIIKQNGSLDTCSQLQQQLDEDVNKIYEYNTNDKENGK